MKYTDSALAAFLTAVRDNPEATVVVSDVHSNSDFVNFLMLTGLVDQQGDRLVENPLVQMGDLMDGNVNRCSARQDMLCFEIGLGLFDVVLIGNHEAPYIQHPDSKANLDFDGMNKSADLYKYFYVVRQGIEGTDNKIAFAYSDGRYLVTHAGLTETMRINHLPEVDPALIADVLNDIGRDWLLSGRDDRLISAVGKARGGHNPSGGILWADWHRELYNNNHPRIPQIVGHTPIDHRQGDSLQIERVSNKSRCIDYGKGTITALVLTDDPVRFTAGRE